MKIIQSKELRFRVPLSTRRKTDVIVIHHTAGNPRNTVEQVHAQHVNRGWSGIGYHLFNRLDGDTWKAYYGRPLHTIGSHVASHNSNSIGIAFAGNYEENQPTDALLKHIREVLAWASKEYPTARFAYHRIMRGASTACPGKNLIPHLRQIAKELQLPTVAGF